MNELVKAFKPDTRKNPALPTRKFIETKEGIKEATYIYKLENLNNGKLYIGMTCNPRQRANSHFYSLRVHKHRNRLLNEDSSCDFCYEILEKIDSRLEAKEKEKLYMEKYKTYDERFGYNAIDPKAQDLRIGVGLPIICAGFKGRLA